jgi:hypothetical protein
MSYYKPSLDPTDDISPFRVSKHLIDLNKISKNQTPIALFDFHKDVFVIIDDHCIPGKVFDYFSPLLVTYDWILTGKVKFHLGTSRSFECFELKGSYLQNIINIAMKKVIFYPNDYYINYENLTVSMTGKAKQLCEIFDNPEDENEDEEDEEISSWVNIDSNRMVYVHQLLQQALANNSFVNEDDQ